jgi:hypothetical protein
MINAKILCALGALAGMLVFSAPAFAEFESNSSFTSGLADTGAFVLEGGGGTLECTGTEGVWTIFSGGFEATKGSQLRLGIVKWINCHAKSSLVKNVAAIPSTCTLELHQVAGEATAKASITTNCTFEFKVLSTCVITMPAGQSGLTENSLDNISEHTLVISNLGGITLKPGAACLGIKETKEGKLKANFIAEGVKWV